MKKGTFERIVLAVDGSDAAIRAGKMAVMLAKKNNAELYALYVVDTATIKELLLSKIFIDEESKEYETSMEENGKKYLHLIAELADKKKCKVETVLEKGSIYSKIIQFTMEKGGDLVIVGGRRGGVKKTGATRDLLTSEYNKVIREAPVPVLVVKGEEIDSQFEKFK